MKWTQEVHNSVVDKNGFCLGQKRVEEKTNEIRAIPELLDCLNIKGTIISTDAMGTQTAIVKKIRQKRADYVLALKANQGNLLEDVVRAVRGHWMVESYHWHLDVTFREYGNHTLEKQTAYNLNIMRKLSLNILKLIEVESRPAFLH